MQPEFNIELYNKRLEELFSRFQSVQKVGFTGNAYKPGLGGMLRLSALLGDPWKAYPCIHVAGTNGKGSVCSMLAAALAAGESVRSATATHGLTQKTSANGLSCRRIGLYTSPHLLDFRERIKVVSADGYEMISREEVWEFLNSYEDAFEGLSFFEITTGMAFWWFKRQGVDAAVIETGLGGRLDSTNIITPVLSVVTSIGLDHCALLGSTRAAIAREKAGIFKPGVPAVVGMRDPETAPVFEEAAAAVRAPLTFVSDVPSFDGEASLLAQMDLTGPCQDINLHTVLVALDILFDLPRKQPKTRKVMALEAVPSLKTSKIKEGHGFGGHTFLENRQKQGRSQGEMFKALIDAITNAGKRTGLWGRWQRICEKPEVICDIGHNPPALKENFARLEALQAGRQGNDSQDGKIRNGSHDTGRGLIIVYGIMADKDLAGIAPLMPAGAKYILAAPDNQRALPADQLKAQLAELRPDLDCTATSSVAAAVRQALTLAQDLPNPLIYIGGSTFTVAEALPLFNENTAI
jgi:dihydrofolate synthase/folylpolyglutamate synthase